jgi:cytochrome c-type biogenesis protein CcmH
MFFWVAIAVLAAAAAGLVLVRAARSAADAKVGGPDAASEVFRRQIAEIDDLADAGLLPQAEQASARAEAGRRLLSTRPEGVSLTSPSGPPVGLLLSVAATAVLGLAIYWIVGKPGLPDMPFERRLEAWRAADPQTLTAAQVAGVLGAIARERPSDPQLLMLLGKARLAAEQYPAAADSFRRAARLTPTNAESHRLLGEALLQAQADGPAPPEAETAFRRAVELDPNDPAARYFLGETASRRGDMTSAVGEWRKAIDLLPADDERRSFLEQQIAEATEIGGSEAAMIEGMVGRLSERLKADPSDAEGWARLVRSYGVLGRPEAQAQALASARKALAGRPADLAQVEAEADR